MLANIPSVTQNTRIILSPDRDVSIGMIWLTRDRLARQGYGRIEIVPSKKGNELVSVFVRGSAECVISVGREPTETKVQCLALIGALENLFPDKLQTEVSLSASNDVPYDHLNELAEKIIAAGFKYAGINDIGFIGKPASDRN
jgi:biopolymer transport protein ExbD